MTEPERSKLGRSPRRGGPNRLAGRDGHTTDGLEELVVEHERIRRALDELVDTSGPAWEKKDQLKQLRQLISRHEDVEASILAPVIRSRLDHGHRQWRSSRRLYRHIDSLLALIDRRSISSPDLPQLVEGLRRAVGELIARQDTVTFPGLRAALAGQELEHLGDRVAAARHHATSRPHPYVPHRGMLARLVRPEAAILDKLRDRTPPRL